MTLLQPTNLSGQACAYHVILNTIPPGFQTGFISNLLINIIIICELAVSACPGGMIKVNTTDK